MKLSKRRLAPRDNPLDSSCSLRDFDQGFDLPVCGMDEVGRGPLAGPVVAACVFIPPENLTDPIWNHVNDSKKLSSTAREKLDPDIRALCFFEIIDISPAEIDRINIHQASLEAMRRAYHNIADRLPPHHALVDGKFTPALPCPAQAVVKGDMRSLAIAAASILAKVHRDRLMTRLHDVFPVYDWDKNAGYGTPAHLRAIKTHGLTPHHRLSFAPCAEALSL
ncbi:MAG: ribonuclease HII [Alphaproteobacteria bacterium]|nr:ribonuclease HII [Alphaproteobacteria bacterium]